MEKVLTNRDGRETTLLSIDSLMFVAESNEYMFHDPDILSIEEITVYPVIESKQTGNSKCFLHIVNTKNRTRFKATVLSDFLMQAAVDLSHFEFGCR